MPPSKTEPKADPKPAPAAKKKLSYKEQKELETLPQTIEKLENELAQLHQQLADPALYQQGTAAVQALQTKATTAEKALETAFERWSELDSR
jgi:ATP-binding cassette subfamily F protein uup